MTSHTFWKKDYLKKVRDFFSKNMIGGNTRDESSIQLQKQAHVKKKSHEIEEEDGAYVSKPGTNACMASNHKSLHICFLESLQEETLMHSNKIGDEEIIIELILEQREEKIIIFKPCHQEERHRAIGKRESPDGIPG
jgi:ribosomal protein L21